MIEQTISSHQARLIYNQLGSRLDKARRFEDHAKARALELLDILPGQRILHVAVGTGYEHARLQQALGTHGFLAGLDLSRTMLQLTRQHASTALCEADAGRLPFKHHSFDRLFSAYMLDLIPLGDIPSVLREFRRVLRPEGRIVLVSLTEGVDLHSRIFVAGWKLLYRLNPQRLGGCRPLQLNGMLAKAGFRVQRHVIIQRGFPSELLVGE